MTMLADARTLTNGRVGVDEDWQLADALLGAQEVVVFAGEVRSKPYPLGVGMAEGRVLSPPFFAVAASQFEACVDHAGIPGVGLDAPWEAIAAFHECASGEDWELPELHRCRAWVNGALAGQWSWHQAMRDAGNDSNRLAILDLASSVRVRLLQLLDDNRVKASSWGGLVQVADVLQQAAHDLRAEF